MSGKVCVFGSFNFDMVARVDRFPVPGESLVACGSMTSAGGKGANQATAALKAGANVHYIGKIGNDTFGHFARRHLKGVGFNAVTLLVAEEIPTGNALIYVAGNDAENIKGLRFNGYPDSAGAVDFFPRLLFCRPARGGAD